MTGSPPSGHGGCPHPRESLGTCVSQTGREGACQLPPRVWPLPRPRTASRPLVFTPVHSGAGVDGGSPASAHTPTQGGWARSSREESQMSGPEQGAQGVLYPGGGEQRTPGSHPCATDGGRVRAPALLRASLFISSHSGSPPGLPLVAMNRGCHCLRLRASLCGGFSPCGGRALSVSSAVAAPGFSRQTCVPCIGRRALNPWTSREAPLSAS